MRIGYLLLLFLLDAAIADLSVVNEKALSVPRAKALKRVVRTSDTNRVVFPVTYHPALPSVPAIIGKHHRTMINKDPGLKETFSKPPMVAYRRPPNLRNKLIRSKLPAPAPTQTNTRPKREIVGMKKCRRPRCETCDFVKEGKILKAKATTAVTTINAAVDCRETNYIYLINCKKCGLQYVGKSKVEFSTRMAQHRGDVTNSRLHKAIGEHFNRKGHKLSDFECSILEKVHDKDPMVLAVKEQYWIRRYNVKHKGINKNQS